jgi:Protein of unknown function (DUF2510)
MSAGPGWYPDPNDPANVRYHDGAAWTEHTAPAAPAAPADPSTQGYPTAAEHGGTSQTGQGYGGQNYGGQNYGGQNYPGQTYPGQTYAGQNQAQQGYGIPSYASQGYPQPGHAAPPGTGPGRARWPFAVAGGVLVLVVAGLATWGATSGGWFDGAQPEPARSDTPTVAPTTDPTDPGTDGASPSDPSSAPSDDPSSTAGATSDGGALTLDTATTVAVPDGSAVTATVDLPADGIYLISATSTDGSDPYLTLTTPSGEELTGDYYPRPAEALGVSDDDAMIAGWFTAGTHTVAISDYYDAAAGIEVTVRSLGEADGALVEAVPTAIAVPEGGVWIGYVDVAAGQTLEVDVRTTSGNDLTAAVATRDGAVWENDDRSSEVQEDVGGDSLDPYVQTEAPPEGRAVVMIADFDGAAGTAEVTPWIIR